MCLQLLHQAVGIVDTPISNTVRDACEVSGADTAATATAAAQEIRYHGGFLSPVIVVVAQQL